MDEVGGLSGLYQVCLMAQGVFWGCPSSGKGVLVGDEGV